MKVKLIIILFVLNILLCSNVFAKGFLYVKVTNETQKPINAAKTNNQLLNSLFTRFGVIAYYQSFPNAKSAELASFYEIHADGDVEALEYQLRNQKYYSEIYYCDSYVHACDEPVTVNDEWIVKEWAYNRALELLDAECAWSITKGSRDVIVGVIDTEFDINHEDLVDTFESVVGIRTDTIHHGTSVSSCVASGTNNGIGIAGIGYKTRVRGYHTDRYSNNLWNAIWAAYQDGIKIINVSWSGIGSYPIIKAVEEMVNNGVVLVLAAGNKNNDTSHQAYADIPGVINVSGIDYYNRPFDHAQNRWVDVCALSILVDVCLPASISPNKKYGVKAGTSYAAPQVAGVVALMRAVNPNLTSAEIENIIKSTTDTIENAHLFVDGNGNSLIGTGRVNAYKALQKVLEESSDNFMIEINNNQTWNEDRYVFGTVIIPSGKTLTITSNVKFSRNSKIIVEQGGHLVVNGGTITNAFPSTSWKGIECWGNNGDLKKQYGRVTLTNATIENAKVGVTLAKRGFSAIRPDIYQAQSYSAPPIQFIDIDMNYSGGYISASNSNFINNGRAVEFYTYSRTNTSTFNGCNFKITKSDYNMQNSMFYMYGTNGVKIVDCNFEVSDGVTVPGMRGIDSYNSAFKVYPSCTHSVKELMAHFTPYCPNPASDNYGVFKNLDYGIYATGNSGGLPYNVRFAKFVNTKRCIYSSGIDNIVITDCIMDIPKPTYSIGGSYTDLPLISENTLHYGVYCNGSTGYQIEGNDIKGIALEGLNAKVYKQGTYGIVINNSGGAANMVYNNNLSYLEVGVQGQGENRDAVSGTGLCVACNTFSTNRTDIAVLSSTIATKNSIAKHQYSNDGKPAANIFSSDSYSGHLWDMYNYQGGPLIYYYGYSSVNKCLMTRYYGSISQYNSSTPIEGTHSVICPRTSGSYSIQSLGSSQEVVQTTKMQLSTKVDGGNTLQLISSIEGATQNDSNELRDNLLAVSSYMSNEAVSAAIENEDAVSNVMVRDIMVGNNHAAREPELMGQVESRNNPLPAYMYDQIDYAANNSVSGLDILQSNLQNSMVEYNVKFNVISNSMLSNDSIEEWEALMDGSINNDVRYGYAIYNALKGNISKANEVIASIEDLDSDYIDLFSVIANDSIAYGKITEGSVETLMSIAESNNRVGVLANNILSGLGYIDYEEPIYTIPDESNFKRDNNKRQRRVADAMTDKLSVYPNPAKDYITVKYNAIGLGKDLTLTISDIDGKMIRNDKLVNMVDSKNIDIKNLKVGSYILNICSEGKVVYSNVFVVK